MWDVAKGSVFRRKKLAFDIFSLFLVIHLLGKI